jgi:hypothetical protein
VNKMNVKPNINILNALIRITIGLTILSWSTAKLVKHPWRDSYLFAALCGAMKVAEGIVRYCPITALFEKCQCMIQEHDEAMESMDGMEGITDGDQMVPYNPT